MSKDLAGRDSRRFTHGMKSAEEGWLVEDLNPIAKRPVHLRPGNKDLNTVLQRVLDSRAAQREIGQQPPIAEDAAHPQAPNEFRQQVKLDLMARLEHR